MGCGITREMGMGCLFPLTAQGSTPVPDGGFYKPVQGGVKLFPAPGMADGWTVLQESQLRSVSSSGRAYRYQRSS